MNKITLIGRLTKDVELRYTQSGTGVASFTLAVDRQFKNQQGEKETDFIDVTCWRKLAEIVANNIGKGRLVAVDGRLQIDNFEKDGQKRKAAKVIADSVQFLDRPKNNEPVDESGLPDDDTIPF